jgi:membrane protein involved in D-alanine export
MLVDLASTKFWLIVAVAVILLNAIVHVRARRAVLAMINLSFLYMLMGHRVAWILAGLALLWVALQFAAGSSLRPAAIAAILLATLLLFVAHKIPAFAAHAHLARLSPILLAVGYSYVFLRVIDAARATWEKRHPPPGPIDLLNYLLPFHMLAAGPIQAWDDFLAQPPIPDALTFDQSLTLIERIVQGLFKKFVLAMAVSEIFITHGRAGGIYRLVEMNMTYVWLYLDFSAYSDIAVGIGGLMGVATPENFNSPYVARNITEFWERWHISLSMWIRRNLFFPMQIALVRRTNGRHALACACIAIFIAFMLCGAWHGLTPPFFWWGVANAGGLVICNLYRYWLKKTLGTKGVARYMQSWPIRILAVVITFEFVAFTIMLIATKWGGTS